MDLLFKRYASPFLLVDQMIQVRQFSEFVSQLHEMDSDDGLWQFFLHKVDGLSFDEWKSKLSDNQSGTQMSNNEIETTIIDACNVIKHFIPND